MSYTKFPRGSEWRRWDLHIHTPETKKNDHFIGLTPQEKWTNYINDINASTEEIAVIGITDYFSIDNYFKFKKAIADGFITKTFNLVLPNIELRVVPVTGSATPINLHCIFNPDIDSEITARFLSKLKFSYGGSDFSAQTDELKRLGRALPGNSTLNDEGALKAGINQYVIEVGVLARIFKDDKVLRENTVIIVSNKSTDGATGSIQHADFFISKNQSQLDATRWNIYQFADAIFSSNERDILYFLGLGGTDSKETVIEKCKALMPCFHGCDAHDNTKIFKPDDNRFCWIKADPTFQGLKQTLYEPEDRVKIQSLKPDVKNPRFVISELEFVDAGKLVGNQKILLNENLNAIIGGKSSGKSLLLYSAARSIDPKQVDKLSQRLGFEGYNFPFDFKVTWKSGEFDNYKDNSENKIHKITYIPQLYINHLVEKNNKEDLNKLIEGILLQDHDFRTFYENTKEDIAKSTKEIEALLALYLQTRNKANDLQAKSKELGKSGSIRTGIDGLKATIEAGQKASNLNKTEFDEFNNLSAQKTELERQNQLLSDKSKIANEILDEVLTTKTVLLGKRAIDEISIRGSLDQILDQFTVIPNDIENILKTLNEDFDAIIIKLRKQIVELNIAKGQSEIKTKIDEINTKLTPYLKKIAGQQELQKLNLQLQQEQLKLEQALNLEKQLIAVMTDYKNIRDKTVVLMQTRFDLYKSLVNHINITKNNIDTEISLTCDLLYSLDKFPLFEQVNKAAISGDNIFYTLFDRNLVKYEEVIKFYSYQLRLIDNKLTYDGDKHIPLKGNTTLESVLRGLLSDNFKIDYTVRYKSDDLLSMSPGKKGTVLLILFLQISSSEFPILIDQPEDNLDNRTIYDLLCRMIKSKKKDRQIIIVSHNANLVIATDSENIIVANQEGQNETSSTSHYRFEYVNGSLEHSFAKNDKIVDVLMQQGIKEHACDILEGGDEAFKQRERKYSIK